MGLLLPGGGSLVGTAHAAHSDMSQPRRGSHTLQVPASLLPKLEQAWSRHHQQS